MRFSATNYEEEKDVGSSRYDESTGFHTCSYNIKEAFTTKTLRNDDGKLIIVLYHTYTCVRMM